MRDAADARKRGLGIGFPLAALICMLGASLFATLEPSLQLCQGAHFSLRAMLVRICPGETAFEALTLPVFHFLFNVTWSLFSYGWRPFDRLPDSAQNQTMGSDVPHGDESHRRALKAGDDKAGAAPSGAAQLLPEPPRGFGRRLPTAPGGLPPVPSPASTSAIGSTGSEGPAQTTGPSQAAVPTQTARTVPTFGRKGLAPVKPRE